MSSLLPPSATPLERAIESACRPEVRLDPSEILDPRTCRAEFLPVLAYEAGVDYWRATWTTEQKREVIAQMLRVHQTRGTYASVQRAIGALGARLQLSEWYEYGGEPYTAKVTAYINDVLADGAEVISAELLTDLLRILDAYAPLRVQIDLEVGAEFRPTLSTPGAMTRPTAVQHAQAFGADTQIENGTGNRIISAILSRPVVIASFSGATA